MPFVPPARRGGRKREVNVREVINAIFYVLSTDCQWNALPKDLPPKSTAHDYFILLDRDGALQRMHEALYLMAREQAGREASPTVAIIDSQSVEAAQKGALDWTRKDITRKVTGRKRHVLVDTLGLLLSVVHSFQQRARSRRRARCSASGAAAFPIHRNDLRRCRLSGAKDGEDGRSHGSLEDRHRQAIRCASLRVVPKRWIVERTLAWISRNRRLARDFERYATTARSLRPPRHHPHHAQTTDQAKPLLMKSNLSGSALSSQA